MMGELVTVLCTAPGRCSGTAPEITWSPHSQFGYYPSVHNIHNPDGTIIPRSTITFTASRDQNNKRLSCSVYFPAVGASSARSVRLNVEYAPAAPEIIQYDTEGATHTLIASSMVMQEGFDYTLVCTVDSNPLSKLTWKKSENILEESGSSSNTLQLTLRKVSSSDDGDYYCLATNKHGSRITFITAHVEYSPRTPKINEEGVTIPGDSRVAIIGIVGASILLLALLVGVSLCVTRKIRKRGNTGNRNMNMASNDTTVDPTYQELQPRQSDTYSELKRDGK